MAVDTIPDTSAATSPPPSPGRELVAFGKQIAFRPGFEWLERCDLCGATEFTPRKVYPQYLLFTGEQFRLVRCTGCSLSFLNPRPGPGVIGEYYPPDYGAHMNVPRPLQRWQELAGGKDAPPPGLLRRLRLHVRQSVSWYFIPPFERGGRFIDIGCGSGKLLDTMKKLGWETYGVEFAASAVERACAKGHRVEVGTAEALAHPEGTFDAAYMWHVLEHTHSPRLALANAYRYLKPGGRFYLCVPNFRSVHAAMFGRYWWSTDAPRHLFQFEAKTIRDYLARTGFEDVQITTRTGASSWLRGFRHTLNGWFGTRMTRDPDWLLAAFDVPVTLSSLVRFFGAGSELRVACRKPA